MLKCNLKKGQNLPWDCTYPIKASESYDQSVNHLEPQLNSLAWSSKKWWMRILSDLHEILEVFLSSDPWHRHIVDTILDPGNKMTYIPQIAIFPHFVIRWIHFIVNVFNLFKPVLRVYLQYYGLLKASEPHLSRLRKEYNIWNTILETWSNELKRLAMTPFKRSKKVSPTLIYLIRWNHRLHFYPFILELFKMTAVVYGSCLWKTFWLNKCKAVFSCVEQD